MNPTLLPHPPFSQSYKLKHFDPLSLVSIMIWLPKETEAE